jgi:DNA-binding IclR family transcriptional regulator
MISESEKQVKTPRDAASGTIRSVEKVIDILELLAREGHGMALGEIAKRLDLNASTAHHLIATLRHRGLVSQDERTKMYRIGYHLVAMVGTFVANTDLYPAGIAPVEELRDLTGETSYLSAFDGHDTASIISLAGMNPVQARRVHRPGKTKLHSTATGKLRLAYLPPDEASALISASELTPFTPNTITDPQRLLTELEEIRRCGYALDKEEDYVGLECIAFPVFSAAGECVASVSISFPAAAPERRNELIPLVSQAAAKISANLGASPVRSHS